MYSFPSFLLCQLDLEKNRFRVSYIRRSSLLTNTSNTLCDSPSLYSLYAQTHMSIDRYIGGYTNTGRVISHINVYYIPRESPFFYTRLAVRFSYFRLFVDVSFLRHYEHDRSNELLDKIPDIQKCFQFPFVQFIRSCQLRLPLTNHYIQFGSCVRISVNFSVTFE